jgi:hypothetical protein
MIFCRNIFACAAAPKKHETDGIIVDGQKEYPEIRFGTTCLLKF